MTKVDYPNEIDLSLHRAKNYVPTPELCTASPPVIKDSGFREEFTTGAVRDTLEGKGRFDLIPYHSIERLAIHFEGGAKKYKARNWEKGIPLSCFVNSAERHLGKFKAGMRDEDHLAATLWNVVCLMETMRRIETGALPTSLDDMEPRFTVRLP